TQDALKEALKEGKFDGLMISRYKRTTESTNYTPGAAWDWSGYYSVYGPYAPGYWNVTLLTQMGTSLFDTKTRGKGRLIWSGTSATSESGASGTAISNQDIAHYADVIVGRMTKDIMG